jgi:hypothetical protein
MNCKIRRRDGLQVEAELTTEHSFSSSGQPVLLFDDRAYEPVDAAINGIEICSCDDAELLKRWRRLHNQTVGRKF